MGREDSPLTVGFGVFSLTTDAEDTVVLVTCVFAMVAMVTVGVGACVLVVAGAGTGD